MNILSFFLPQLIAKFSSKYNGEIKIVESWGKKIVYVKKAEQTGGTITGMWQKSISKIKYQNSLPAQAGKIQNCLVLGLGGGDVIRLLNKYYKGIKMTVVEIDPVMVDIADRFFHIKTRSKLQIITADALLWLKKYHGVKFDLIVVDLFIGKNNPSKSRETEFIGDIKNLLRNDGVVLFNSHYAQDNSKSYINLLKVCRNVFDSVEEIAAYRYSRILALS